MKKNRICNPITQGENWKENKINMQKRLTILADYKLSPFEAGSFFIFIYFYLFIRHIHYYRQHLQLKTDIIRMARSYMATLEGTKSMPEMGPKITKQYCAQTYGIKHTDNACGD